jgi:hypothetical protein
MDYTDTLHSFYRLAESTYEQHASACALIGMSREDYISLFMRTAKPNSFTTIHLPDSNGYEA